MALVFALVSWFVVACGSDAPKSGGTDPTAGASSERAGMPGAGDVGGSDSAGAASSDSAGAASSEHGGGAPSRGGAGSGTKTGTVKLNLKVK